MMKKRSVLFAAVLTGMITLNIVDAKAQTTTKTTTPNFAATLKAADEMLAVSGAKEQFESNRNASIAQMAADAPDEKRPKITEVMTAFMNKYLTWEIMKPELCQIYAHEFTEAELKQLTAFYKSPVAKKLQAKMPLISSISTNLGQKTVADHQTELQQMLTEAMK